MTLSGVELNSDEKRRTRNRNVFEKLRQSAERLADLHSQEKVGKPINFSPHSTGEKDHDVTPAVSEPNEFANEWRPAEEKDSEPSQAGDIFSLGCYFYYVITGGQHPFGKPGHRALFIANNLYDLTACRDGPLKKLIARMIDHDSTKRPSSSELLKHPYLWKEDRAESYLTAIAENLDEKSEKYQIWKGTVLFSFDLHASEFDTVRETSIVKSILRILVEIKEKKETAINACQLFPDLLSTVYFNENPDFIQIDDSCQTFFGNVLIANGGFAEVQPDIGIKRRHGRFGTQPVHVMQFPDLTADTESLMTRLSCLNHPNLLQYFYLDENSTENVAFWLACEPFDETLDTWMEKNSQPIKLETAKEILTQITTGLVYYHSNNLIHGNLTSNQIAITNSGTIIAKISKFPIEESIAESPSPTRQNDVRKLGHIYSDLLQRVEDVLPLCTDHLLKSMKDTKDECTPPSDAVFYHPFFWSSEDTADFLLTSGDFYEDNPTIDKNLSVGITTSLIPEYQQLKTSRSAIEYFLTTNESAPEDSVMLVAQFNKHFPMLATQTWLRLQTFKMTEENFGLGSFYHPFYDFPTYDELTCDEKMASEVVEKNFHSPKDESERAASMEVSLSDEGYCEEFVIEKFPRPNEKELPVPQLIPNFLEKYVHKWEIAEKSHTRKMKHPVIDDIGRTAMHLACYSDDFYESATKLMKLGFNPNTCDKNGYVPLHVAALNNSIKIAELLIENNAIIDKCDLNESRTPLFLAAIYNCFAMLKLLIKKHAKINKVDAFGLSPLHIAVASNANDSYKVAELLLKKHADVDARDGKGNTPLYIAVAKKRADIVELLLQFNADPNIVVSNNRFGGVLHLAVANCSPEILHLLLTCERTNPNLPNFQGESPLHLAASLRVESETRQRVEIETRQRVVDMLISYGANPNAINRSGISVLHAATLNKAEDVVERILKIRGIEVDQQKNERKVTPLHLAAWYKHENIAQKLIEGGANIDARDYNGETPLEYAASSDAVTVAKELLKHGAVVNSERWKKRSPLHIAAAHGAQEVAQLLIDKDADVNAVDEFGLTPLHYAEYRNYKEFVEFLRPKTSSHTNGAAFSNPLSPTDLALIPSLTNSFQLASIPPFQIELPAFLGLNIDLKVNQQILMYSSNTI